MDEAQPEEYEEQTGVSTYWWIRQIILVLIAGFYLVLGIQLLVSAYQLNDPPNFILTFYASNFMILNVLRIKLYDSYQRRSSGGLYLSPVNHLSPP
jgi:hypothetical protein